MNDSATPRVDPALVAGNRRPAAGYQAATSCGTSTAASAASCSTGPSARTRSPSIPTPSCATCSAQLKYASDVHAVVLSGAGDNFCSGGDVHEIIGPLVRLKAPELLMFTRMTGDLVKAMRACPQPIVAAIDGVCAGAGAIVAMASDLRVGTARSKTAFLFNRVGLAGCDMGACAMLPRIVGQGRASELLYTGPLDERRRGRALGLLQPAGRPERTLEEDAMAIARDLVAGPTFANGITKTMLHQEWAMTIEQAIEAEAQAQAICMLTQDFTRAYEAFAAKQKPRFEGN